MYLKATLKSVLAERILTQLTTQLHPEIEQYKTSWNHIVDAAKMMNFISTTGMVFSVFIYK